MVTDWEDYANHALEELSACSLLKNDYDAFASPRNWRPVTNFEKRGIEESRAIKELFFRRKM
jgi:tRNA (guanine-N7-)-methyltransferase